MHSVDVNGLVDSGSTVNLLPLSIGLVLGGQWEEQWVLPPLTGVFGRLEVRGLLATVSNHELTGGLPVELIFAWAQRDDVPVLLGQVNFFLEFDVCFYRSEGVFDVTRRTHDEE
jgi:hypothetical protein